MDKGTEDPVRDAAPFLIIQFMKQSFRMIVWMKERMELIAINEMN
ncbi:MAG: hypothetical protein PHQ83_11145 [Eubacteriales bacterium]|nr:hypothetical protein [Eubacteriales bacterium]